MAYANIDTARFNADGLKARFIHIRELIADKVARYAIYRQTSAELHALSGRELADLGIMRSDIPRIAKQAADLA